MHQLRLDIGHDADHALAAQSQQGNHLIVVAGINVQLVAAQLCDLGYLRDVAGSFLDAVNQRMLAQFQSSLRGNVQAGAEGTLYMITGMLRLSMAVK